MFLDDWRHGLEHGRAALAAPAPEPVPLTDDGPGTRSAALHEAWVRNGGDQFYGPLFWDEVVARFSDIASLIEFATPAPEPGIDVEWLYEAIPPALAALRNVSELVVGPDGWTRLYAEALAAEYARLAIPSREKEDEPHAR